MSTRTIQTKHGKVTLSTGPVSGLAFASITDPNGATLPLFNWMPENGDAVDRYVFEHELETMVAMGDTAPEGAEHWLAIRKAWDAAVMEQLNLFMALDSI